MGGCEKGVTGSNLFEKARQIGFLTSQFLIALNMLGNIINLQERDFEN
jgi:hypothetical protein